MTTDVKMFLALNALVNGYGMEYSFQGDIGGILGIEDQELVQKLCESIDDLPEPILSRDPMVLVLLNFYRNSDYTTLAAGPGYLIPLEQFAESEISGKGDPATSRAFRKRLLMDCVLTNEAGNPHIIDGVLYCTREEWENVQEASDAAYKLYTVGPDGLTKKLNRLLRKYTSLDAYAPMNPMIMLELLEQIIRCGIKPHTFLRTFLKVPNLLPVYEKTGCVMAFSDTTRTEVNWIMELEGANNVSVSVSVPVDSLRTHVLNSVRDLEGARVGAGRNPGSYNIIYPGD